MTSRQQIPDSILRAIQEVANDKERGASSISQQALRTLVTAADQIQAGEVAEYLTQMRLIAEALRRARPAMAPVRYWVTRFERTALDLNRSFSSVDTARQFVSNVARALLVDAEAAQVEAARRAASQLDRFRRLATCSWSGTVIEFFNIAAQRQPDVSVTVLESQPGTSAALWRSSGAAPAHPWHHG